MPDLDARLTMTASLVRAGRRLVDIGTDHAYLPCELVKRGLTPCAIAADIADGPLKNAEKTVRTYGLSDRILCRKSDGLSALAPEQCEEIVIAGMGGNLIVDILSAAAWIKSAHVHLILQPMTHSEDVRRFLCQNGFVIERETAVLQADKVYIALSASYCGAADAADAFFYYFGLHISSSNPASHLFIKKQKARLVKKYHGFSRSAASFEEAAALGSILTDERLKGF